MVLGQASAGRSPRDQTSSWSVSLIIAPASSSSVQRARPSGGLEQAVATSRASSLLVSFADRSFCPRLLVQGGFEIAFNEAALGPVNGRTCRQRRRRQYRRRRDRLSAVSRIWARLICGRNACRCPPARRVHPLGFAQFGYGSVCFIRASSRIATPQTNQAIDPIVWRVSPTTFPCSPTSKVNTWPSSTPIAGSSANRPRKPTCSGTSKSRHPACTRCAHPRTRRPHQADPGRRPQH